jgi:hypothetical protein
VAECSVVERSVVERSECNMMERRWRSMVERSMADGILRGAKHQAVSREGPLVCIDHRGGADRVRPEAEGSWSQSSRGARYGEEEEILESLTCGVVTVFSQPQSLSFNRPLSSCLASSWLSEFSIKIMLILNPKHA